MAQGLFRGPAGRSADERARRIAGRCCTQAVRCAFVALFAIAAPIAAADSENQEPAQTATIPVDAEQAPTPRDTGATVLDDLVVTATKREQSTREIAGSVSALSGEQLDQMGAREQEDFLKLIPGVSVFKGEPNQNRINIRGIVEDYGTAQSTGTLIGDVPFTDPFVADQSPDLSPFDLQTVEVLKGPQGTLFGASGLGGALRYVVRPAELAVWQAKGFVAYDSLEHGESAPTYGVALNAPLLRDDLALRLVGTQRRRPGLIDESGRDEQDIDRSEQSSYRGLLRYASERLDVQILHLAQDTTIDDLGFVDTLDGLLERDSTPTPSPTISDFSLDTLTLSYDFGWAHLVSITGDVTKRFGTDTDTSRLVPATRVWGQASVDGYTQEIRLLSPSEAGRSWQWLVGVFAMRYDNVRRVELQGDTLAATGAPLPRLPFIPGTVGVSGDDSGLIARYDLDAFAQEQALFGEITRSLGSIADVTLGLRAYRTDSEGTATASGPLNLLLSGEQESRNDADIGDTGLNPKLALRVHLADDVMVYGLAARGYRFGGISLIADTATDDVPATYRSDRIWLYEAGLRTAWLERSLVADASVYRINWSDPQITQLTDSGLLTYTDNAGGARVLGGELALGYRTPIEGLSLQAAMAYTDARITEAFTAASGTEVPEGARWPFTPRTQFATTLSYLTNLGAWGLAAEVLHAQTGKAFGNIENTVPIFDYETLDARIRISAGHLVAAPELTFSATNLLDERGVASRMDAGDISTIYYVRPRALSLQLGVRF